MIHVGTVESFVVFWTGLASTRQHRNDSWMNNEEGDSHDVLQGALSAGHT